MAALVVALALPAQDAPPAPDGGVAAEAEPERSTTGGTAADDLTSPTVGAPIVDAELSALSAPEAAESATVEAGATPSVEAAKQPPLDATAEAPLATAAGGVPTSALLLALATLLGFSFFFSGSETALFSLTRIQINRLERVAKPSRAQRAVLSLMDDSRDTLITILIGNMMANVATSLVVGALVARLFAAHPVASFLVGTVLATLALLILGEIMPKTMALEVAESWALAIARPLAAVRAVFRPLRHLFTRASEAIFRLLRLPGESETETVTEQEIKGLVMLGHKAGVIQAEQREMIDSVFEFNDETVDKIMTPRVALQAYPIDTGRDQLIKGLVEGGHSRVILYQKNVDHVVGVLHMKDALLRPDENFRQFVRRPLFVPEKKKLSVLLGEFRRSHQHLAIVVDEYGGTAGCVTLNDLLEEIFGDLVEIGDASAPGLRRVGENAWEVDGLFRVDDLNHELDLELPDDDSNTVSGLISNSLGDFPKTNTRLEIGNVTFVVRKMAARRVALARLIVREPKPGEDDRELDSEAAEATA